MNYSILLLTQRGNYGFNIPASILEEENNTGVVEPTTTAPSSVVPNKPTNTTDKKPTSSLNIPINVLEEEKKVTEEPLVTEVDTVIAEMPDYGNEQNPDMKYEPQTAESYAQDTLPVIQDMYAQSVKARFEDDDTNPFLEQELARIDSYFLQTDGISGLTEKGEIQLEDLLVEKYNEEYNRLFTPERVQDIREGALIAWTERQKLLEQFKGRAEDDGYDKVTDWLIWRASEDPELYGRYIDLTSEDDGFVPEIKTRVF